MPGPIAKGIWTNDDVMKAFGSLTLKAHQSLELVRLLGDVNWKLKSSHLSKISPPAGMGSKKLMVTSPTKPSRQQHSGISKGNVKVVSFASRSWAGGSAAKATVVLQRQLVVVLVDVLVLVLVVVVVCGE